MFNKTATTTLILLLTLSILSVFNVMILPVKAALVTTGTIYVSANYTSPSAGEGSSGNPYGSITWALLNCTGNATIYLSPGTYNMTIETFPLSIIRANVTIVSTGTAANTIINASGSTVSACVFNATNTNATIGASGHGFTIQSGASSGTPYVPAYAHAIDVYGDNATIEGNTIKVGQGNTAGVHIVYGNNGTGHLIKGNTFRSAAASEGWGIMAENLTNSVIQNNLFYGDSAYTNSSVEGAPGTGIMINDANNVNITGNTAYYLKYTWLTFIAQHPFLDANNYMYETWRNATITNVRVTNNTVHDNGRAVSFEGGSKAGGVGYVAGTANLTIGTTVNIGPSNKFYNNGDGIVIRENKTRSGVTEPGCVFGAANLKINTNDLYNSARTSWSQGSGFGILCGQTGPVNATFNWWGDPLGPRNATGSVVGDYVSDNATCTLWLTVPHELDEAAALNIYPTSGPPGLYVGLSSQASTFTGATTNVTFYFSGTAVNSTMAESTGAMNGTFKVPESSPGTYTVRALGNDSLSASTSFTIATPTITVSPTRGPVATPVTITGTNWNCSGTVNVDIGNSTYSTDLVTGKPNGTGIFTNTTAIPSLAIGTYTINATDGINSATTSFIIPSRTITLNVTSGPPSLPVLVTGEGYTIGGLVDIYVDTTLVTSTTGIASSGNISVSFAVPAKTAGSYTVKAHDVIANRNATTDFTIPARSITLNVTSGPPGTPVRVYGPNFNCSGTVSVYFNTTAVLTLASNTANGTGYLVNATFKVPYLTSGLYTVNASDGISYATTSFTIPAPSIALNATSGPATTPVRVYGPNFNCSGTVNVYFNTSLVQTATANGTGYLNTTFTVPSIAIGTYVVNASDGINYATTNFTVGAAIYLSPTSGVPGDTVTVTGAGLSANQTIQIYFDNTLKITVNATAAGALPANTNFTVPDAIAGAHNVRALDIYTSTYTPNATFTVNSPSITLPTAEGQVGQSVTVTGSNFKLNATINIYFGSTLVKTVNATAAGALPANTNFTVPSVLPALCTVNASDGVNYATATYNVIGTGGIDTLQTMVAEIEAKLDQYGSFWNFTNTWFTTISNKLGVFTGADTVASLLYSIKTSVSTINWTDITAIKAKTDTINWADITTIKSTTSLSIDYLWGLQDHPLWGLRTKIVPMLESIKNATQFTAGTYNTVIPTSVAPVNLGKSSKITLTVRTTDDTTEGFAIKAYIYDGTAWRPLSFSVSGIASADCAATVEFTTGADGRFYFETTGAATFTAFIYSAEFSP
jgi:hypothetical protein